MCPPPALILTGNSWKNFLLAQPHPMDNIISYIRICNTKNSEMERMEKSTVNIPDIVVSE